MRGVIRKVASWLGLRPSPEPVRGFGGESFVGRNGSNTDALAEARRLLALRRDRIRREKRATGRESARLHSDGKALLREARSALSAAGLSASKPWRTVATRGRMHRRCAVTAAR